MTEVNGWRIQTDPLPDFQIAERVSLTTNGVWKHVGLRIELPRRDEGNDVAFQVLCPRNVCNNVRRHTSSDILAHGELGFGQTQPIRIGIEPAP